MTFELSTYAVSGEGQCHVRSMTRVPDKERLAALLAGGHGTIQDVVTLSAYRYNGERNVGCSRLRLPLLAAR